MLYEATAKNAISIGASENYRPAFGSSSDNFSGMAGFSGRGPTEDGRIKPDFVAPGTQIYSTKSRYAGHRVAGVHMILIIATMAALVWLPQSPLVRQLFY